MGQGEDAGGVRQVQCPVLCLQLAGPDAALHRGIAVVARIHDRREAVRLRGGRRQPVERHIGGGAQQGGEFQGPIDVEQHDLTAIVGQERVQRRQDRRGADGEIDHRLKGQHRRQAAELAGTREALQLALQRIGQPVGLARPVDGEGVVLEGIELRHDAEPGRVGKRRQHGGQTGQTGKARKARDADHGRDQDDAVGAGQLGVRDDVERIFHGEGAAVRKTDQVQGPGGRHPLARLADRKPRSGHPIFPAHVGQAGRHGAVPRQAHADRDEAAIAV